MLLGGDVVLGDVDEGAADGFENVWYRLKVVGAALVGEVGEGV